MNFKDILRWYVRSRWKRTSRDEPLSMVLLQRKPHIFTAEELRLAAERAWRTSFAGTEEGSRHCVVQSGKVTLMKAGPHVLNFFYFPTPYIENPKENEAWLAHQNQRQAWINHSACAGVDYLNHDVSVALGYCVLSKIVAEMLDGNCTGVYIPRQRRLLPNDEALYVELHKLASACKAGDNVKT
jgi:hypothetical protein